MAIGLNSKQGFTKRNHVSGHVILTIEFRHMSGCLCTKLPLLSFTVISNQTPSIRPPSTVHTMFPTAGKVDISGSIIKGGGLLSELYF
jgi:hypothetical protein